VSTGYLSETLRYEVLKRARFRCELCGVSTDNRPPEVGVIAQQPRRGGGAGHAAGDPVAGLGDPRGGPRGCRGRMTRRRITRALLGVVLGAVAALAAFALWWRRNPSACPYGLRFFVELPHPFITRGRLREILAPRPGERVLEVGPGAGYYALPVARWLEPGGSLDVLDVQQKMLDHVMRRAAEGGITNVVPTQADAQALPYPDASFDAAYLTLVLGEIPDQERSLCELRRVLRPGGRLVVGEHISDPHYVAFGALCERAEAAGLEFERRVGGALGYFARFRAT
jgi:protein-L-isoaspartate O-methyltransferase